MDGFDLEQQACGVASFRRARGPAVIRLAIQVLGGSVLPADRDAEVAFFFVAMLLFPRAACDKMTAVCLAFIHRTGKGSET